MSPNTRHLSRIRNGTSYRHCGRTATDLDRTLESPVSQWKDPISWAPTGDTDMAPSSTARTTRPVAGVSWYGCRSPKIKHCQSTGHKASPPPCFLASNCPSHLIEGVLNIACRPLSLSTGLEAQKCQFTGARRGFPLFLGKVAARNLIRTARDRSSSRSDQRLETDSQILQIMLQLKLLGRRWSPRPTAAYGRRAVNITRSALPPTPVLARFQPE